jgi:hypothetical protein
MMNAEEIVRQIRATGVSIHVDDDYLLLRGTGARLAEDFRTLLREHRVEILAFLRSGTPPPRIGTCGELVIPFDADERFQW